MKRPCSLSFNAPLICEPHAAETTEMLDGIASCAGLRTKGLASRINHILHEAEAVKLAENESKN